MMTSSLRQGDGGGDAVFATPRPRARRSQSRQHHLDDVGKTPRITNASGSRGGDDGGVAVDGLTASLLGVSFLPFTAMPASVSSGGPAPGTSNGKLQTHQHHQHMPGDNDARLYFGDLDDNSTLTEDPSDAPAKRSGRARKSGRKRIKGAFKSIKKSIVVRNKSKVSGGKADTPLGRGTSATSVSSSRASAAAPSRLQGGTDEATRRARALTGRIESQTREIAALEQKLAACREALARDVADLDALQNVRGGCPQQRRPPLSGATPTSVLGHTPSQETTQHPEAPKRLSSFIRIHDLDLAKDAASDAATEGEVHTGSTRPDLADVHGSTIAPAIVEALARMAYDAASDDATDRWTPSSDTKKALSKQNELEIGTQNKILLGAGAPWIHVPPQEVFVWHSKFDHGGFGSDLPVVKARGIVFCSAKELVSLLLDSARTKEYNKMSIGRTDEHFFHRNALPGITDEMSNSLGGNDDDCWNELPGETRILRSLSKPPMVKPVELLTLYHARELDSAAGQIDGYLIVSRSIWETECCVPTEGGGGGKKSDSSASRTEMLLGAQLIRSVDDSDRPQCELTTINHLSSKSIPMVMAKKVGLMTAASFIRDIQGVFESAMPT